MANDHMIVVNAALGYKVVRPSWKYYEMPVSAVGEVWWSQQRIGGITDRQAELAFA